MRARTQYLSGALAVLLFLFSLVPAGVAFAQSGSTTVASGLINPGPIAVANDGSIYVAEGGTGGNEKYTDPQGSGTRGYTAQITKIAPGGSTSVVARNLPSLAGPEGASGASDLVYNGGYLWAVWYNTPGGLQPVPGEGSLLRIDPSTGVSQTIASLAAYEAQHNPDGNAVDSNPYGLTIAPDGMVYVADAAANDLLQVNPTSGQVSLVAVFSGIPLPPPAQRPGGNPARGGKQEADPVPTGVQVGPDGALYVSLLSGGPFLPGLAKIERVTRDGQVSDAVTGLTMLTDLKRGADGAWYAVQFAVFDLSAKPPGFKPNSGAIRRIGADGTPQTVVGGLNGVQKIALDPSNNIYASMPSGAVVRFAAATGGSMPGMPRTGAAQPVADLALVGLLLLVLGLATRLTPALARRWHG